ncbi:hypothetical protein CIB48_g10754, partial [Xylaria polymorpha]
IALILRLARHGLIHGDFNEFNILLKEEPIQSSESEEQKQPSKKGKEIEQPPPSANPTSTTSSSSSPEDPATETNVKVTPVLIDFPQMVSMDHANAEMYFDRDVACVKRFFERRFHFVSTQPGPFFRDAKKTVGKNGARRLDAAVEASGFSKKALKDLEAAIREQQQARGPEGEQASASDDDDYGDEDDDDDDLDDQEDGEESGRGVDYDGQSEGEIEAGKGDSAELNIPKLAIKDGT